MQTPMSLQAHAFPEGIKIPGLKPQKFSVERLVEEIELDLPELQLRELSILTRKQRGRR
jgi:hypothetical protein